MSTKHKVHNEDKDKEHNQNRNNENNQDKEKSLAREIFTTFVGAFFAVVLGLGANTYYDDYKDRKTYENSLKAIVMEAVGNQDVLKETFDPKKYTIRPIFRDFSMEIVESSLENKTFIEQANSKVIIDLIKYLDKMKQLNAHRAGLEKIYLNPGIDTNHPEYRINLTNRINEELADFQGKLLNVVTNYGRDALTNYFLLSPNFASTQLQTATNTIPQESNAQH